MTSLEVVPQSTYRTCYRGELPALPLIKYRTLPCMYPPGSTQPCRPTQHHIPLKKGKILIPETPPLPVPAKKRPRSSKTSSASRSTKVFETKYGPMDMNTVDRLYNQMRYATCSQTAGAEYALPVHKPAPSDTTKEQRPDMVRFRSQKYEAQPEQWQNAVLWDRIQTRAPHNRTASPANPILLIRRKSTKPVDLTRSDEISNLVKNEGLAAVFVRKCPGYAGYTPLCPPETQLNDKKTPVSRASLMATSYSKFPDTQYKTQHYGRKGSFSKTVTLTYPFNPFNKVGQEIITENKESRYAGMNHFLDFTS